MGGNKDIYISIAFFSNTNYISQDPVIYNLKFMSNKTSSRDMPSLLILL